jgi:hypothetical protein
VRAQAAAAAALLLAACGGQDGNRAGGATNNASAVAPGEPGASGTAPVPAPGASAGLTMQPGLWEMAVQIRSLDVAGAPPEAQARIRSQVGRTQTNRNCITPEEARNPIGQMRDMVAQGRAASCQFTDQVFGGGVIRIRATCAGPAGRGSSGRVAMEGTFTATTVQATLTFSAQGAANPAMPGVTGVNMAADLRGRRVGECPARPVPPAIRTPVPAPPPPLPRP